MPIYEYECTNCNYQFEQLHKINDAPLKICPECRKHKLTKLISNAIFKLKGNGWYETDFKEKKIKDKNKHEDSDLKPEFKK